MRKIRGSQPEIQKQGKWVAFAEDTVRISEFGFLSGFGLRNSELSQEILTGKMA
jgi:hypothetical protein